MSASTASYRIQLRGGVDFARVASHLDYFEGLGISHLYLSPIFTARSGSTHGYDIIDPNQIDPSLGGHEGFAALARAAKARGIGIILDIVPNHTAFSLENRWLFDVLGKGRESPYAPAFDIDWTAGPLVLPFLPEPFAAMLAADQFRIENDSWRFGDVALPLAAGTGQKGSLEAIHAAQHWTLAHWERERDDITHRRFFNVTELIGMRVEDGAVFARTHELIFELVDAGLVEGLRIDHIDGLADPAQYLDRLAERLPGTPVWIEKILVGDEQTPNGWKTVGTTGYEAARWIARVLTRKEGLDALDVAWRAATGIGETFPQALEVAKADILDNELAAERLQLIALAAEATRDSTKAEPGPEALREAITHLLAGMSRYRTYVVSEADENDAALIDRIVDNTVPHLRSRRVIDLLAHIMKKPDTEAQRRFVMRFQQVSGALLAKAQEDTAGFRWTRYIAANEVGAEPDEAAMDDAEANGFLARRTGWDMTLTSTHDTKRSEDARMRLVAMSHLPDAFLSLCADAEKLDAAGAVSARWRWYIVQSVLAIWTGQADAIGERLDQHVEKAMREAKIESFWTHPNAQAEKEARAFARTLASDWENRRPDALLRLIARGEALSFAQLAFKMVMPGFPDLYRGTEAMFFALTDPDNRLPVDWEKLAGTLDDEKVKWTRALLRLRAERPELFENGDAVLSTDEGRISLVRTSGTTRLSVMVEAQPGHSDTEALLSHTQEDGFGVAVTLAAS